MSEIILSSPRDCYITLTDKCNMRCRHCYGYYGEADVKDELLGLQWNRIIKDLKNNGIFFVNISGGEPTVHPDFCGILNSLIVNNMFFLLTTNGVFNKKCLNAILKAKDVLLGIKISLDGCDSNTHSFLRRDVNGEVNYSFFDTTMKNIKILKENGLSISIATCLHTENINRMEELKKIILEIKPQNWFIATIALSGRAKNDNEIFVSESNLPKKYWLNLKNGLKEENISTVFVDMPSLNKSNKKGSIYFNCPAARTFCDIYSNGLVTPCPLARVNMASFFENSYITKKTIKEIWNGKSFTKFRKLQRDGCYGCKARKKCDRCIPQSVQWFDDSKTPPPYCINNAESLKLKNKEILKEKLQDKIKETNRKEYLEGYDE